MPRKILERSTVLPYHVTARVNNKEDFPLPLGVVWNLFCREIRYIQIIYGVEVQAFLLMPNHFHLILTTPEEDLGIAMCAFMSGITRALNLKSGRSGRIFDKTYYRSIIKDPRYYAVAIKYLYRNPVRAGLAENPEIYPYSTLYYQLGKGWLPFPLHFPRAGWGTSDIYRNLEKFTEWLRKPFLKEQLEAARRNLRRTQFKMPKTIKLNDFEHLR